MRAQLRAVASVAVLMTAAIDCGSGQELGISKSDGNGTTTSGSTSTTGSTTGTGGQTDSSIGGPTTGGSTASSAGQDAQADAQTDATRSPGVCNSADDCTGGQTGSSIGGPTTGGSSASSAGQDAQADAQSDATRSPGVCNSADDCTAVLDYRYGFSCWFPTAASKADVDRDPCLIPWVPNAKCKTPAPPPECPTQGPIPVTHSCLVVPCVSLAATRVPARSLGALGATAPGPMRVRPIARFYGQPIAIRSRLRDSATRRETPKTARATTATAAVAVARYLMV